ncbi:transporter, partial [Acinetobacter baumannii]
GIIQDVPNGAKRSAERLRAAADIGAAEAAQIAETRAVRINTALAWIDLYFAKRRLAALEEIAVGIGKLHATAPARLASGAQRPAQAIEPERL